jgi:hypothetical protein
MSPKRILRVKAVPKITRKAGSSTVTRAEFNAVIQRLNERGKIINDLRRELHSVCDELAERNRRELQTQFTRIAQLQQEIDELKRRT